MSDYGKFSLDIVAVEQDSLLLVPAILKIDDQEIKNERGRLLEKKLQTNLVASFRIE